ncbi:Ferric reductase transmembrane component-like domain, partial [Dillenia turbinata]
METREISASSLSSSSSTSSTSSSYGFPDIEPGSVLCGRTGYLTEDGVKSVAESALEWLRFINQATAGGLQWKEVENRFDRLASTGSGPVPVIESSEFGFCIGMQQNPEFANELLRALRGKSALLSNEITKEQLHNLWCRITNPCFHSRLQIFFDLCDINKDGIITEMEIKQVVMLSATTNKLAISQDEAEEYASLIIHELDTDYKGYIELSQLETLFKASHLARPFTSDQKWTVPDSADKELMSKVEVLFRTYWRRAWVVALWFIICISLFSWKFSQYRHRKAFQVMGYCLCTAKGAAETLKFNMALILIPVCRNTMTWLRANSMINSVIPFNDSINFHKLIAGGIVVGVILHGGTHLACDFPRISNCDHLVFGQTIASRFGNHQPSYGQILATTEVLSGIAMVILMAIAFSLATHLPRRQSPSLPRSIRKVTGYNTFWYTHHLFIIVYALLIVHSMFLFLTSKVMEKTTWMYIAIPVMLYLWERIFRVLRSIDSRVGILEAKVYPGKVLSLKLCKPEGFSYSSGMYVYIQCPQVSSLEWHPFSLTSGPQEDYLSLHIRTLGDWSYEIYNLFQEAILSRNTNYPHIYVDGPYSAASQDYIKYDIIMLIGLGIGATPFISILKDIVDGLQYPNFNHMNEEEPYNTKTPCKAYLYWVTREQGSFSWFREVMKDIWAKNQRQDVVEMHNFLTSVYPKGDARSAVISAIQAFQHAKKGTDIVSQTPVCTHFGRPNWFEIFSNLISRHQGAHIVTRNQVFSIAAHKFWQENYRGCAPNFQPKAQLDWYSTKKTIR